MNAYTNTTAAPDRQVPPDYKAIVDLMDDLEGHMHDLVNMARIMGNMLDHNMRIEPAGDGFVIPMDMQRFNMVAFAYNDVVNRTNSFGERFLAALVGGVQS